MNEIDTINSFLQKELRTRGMRFVCIKDACGWIREAHILRDEKDPEEYLMHLIRNYMINGQTFEADNNWYIKRSDLITANPLRA